ncbi:putative disease resistance protein [Trifolium repens]|nr:putative disease resistance protein [Trifolium repens]
MFKFIKPLLHMCVLVLLYLCFFQDMVDGIKFNIKFFDQIIKFITTKVVSDINLKPTSQKSLERKKKEMPQQPTVQDGNVFFLSSNIKLNETRRIINFNSNIYRITLFL